MPEIPKLESYGFVNPNGPEIPTPSIAGSTAINQATAGLAEAVGKFTNNLIERRTRAQAADFVFDKKMKYSQALDDLSIDLKAKYPDGSGYAEEFKQRADEIRGSLGDGAENQLQTELWNKESGDMFANAVSIARSDGNILKTKAALGRYDAITQQEARRQLERPNYESALKGIQSAKEYADSSPDLWGNPIETQKMTKAGSSQIIESMVNGYAFQERYAEGLSVLARKEVADVLDADTLDKMRDMLNQKRRARDGINMSTLASRVEDYVKTAKSQTLTPDSVRYGQNLRSEILSNSMIKPDQSFQLLNDMDNADSYGKRNLQLGATPTSQLPQFHETLMQDFQSNIDRMAKLHPYSKVTGSEQIMNFSQREKWQNQFGSMLKRDLDARMDDPNKYIFDHNPSLANLRARALDPSPGNESTRDEYFRQLTAQQKQLEVPERVLTNDEAANVSSLLSRPANKALGTSGIDAIQAMYGNYAGAAITDAISQDKNLPKEYALVAKLGNPQSQASMVDVIQNKKVINESFEKSGADEKTTKALINGLVAPVLGATANIRGPAQNLAFSEGLADMTLLESKRLMVNGVSQSDAVKQAFDTVFTKNFDLINTGNSKVLARKGEQQPRVIEAYVDAYSKPKALATLNLQPPPGYVEDLKRRFSGPSSRALSDAAWLPPDQQAARVNELFNSPELAEKIIKEEWPKDLVRYGRFRTDRYGDGMELVLDTGSEVFQTGHSIKFKDILNKNDPYVNAELRGFFGNLMKASF